MYQILSQFEKKYKNLTKKGLKIEGLSMIDPKRKKHVILVSKPFIFDNRELPKVFEGLEVKSKIQGDLPEEFRIKPDRRDKEYIWSPDRFERFVNRCENELRKKFGNPNMTKKDLLDALAFGNFDEHKKKCAQLMKEGKIPPIQLN
ncbi:MAG: hypothetical protein N3F09_02835 [Bacteroidia bacterium]|nr:hypothetical protein [Bacteroidia bacterium]